MTRSIAVPAIVIAMLACGAAAQQTPGPEADPGVRPTRLIDRAEVRVTRVDLQPGATRRMHTHDDVVYHLWIPIDGRLQLTMGIDPAIAANPGQAYFMTRGTSHGFKNVGATAAAVLEIFIKQTTNAVNRNLAGDLAAQWAALIK